MINQSEKSSIFSFDIFTFYFCQSDLKDWYKIASKLVNSSLALLQKAASIGRKTGAFPLLSVSSGDIWTY